MLSSTTVASEGRTASAASPCLRALTGERSPGPGQRGPAARAGRYPVARQVTSRRGAVGIGNGDRRIQAVA